MYSERIKVIIRQTPTTKQETLPKKGVGVAKFDFTKTFRNQLFSCVRMIFKTYFSISYMCNTKSDHFSPKIKLYIYGNRKSNAKS